MHLRLAALAAMCLAPGAALADCPVQISGRSISVAVPQGGACQQTFPSNSIVSSKMVSPPKHGRAGLSPGSNGFAYQASPGYAGADRFSYQVVCTCGPHKELQTNLWTVSVQIQ